MSTQAETFDFQVETRQLLQLMINSIYSDKDLFLRELVSNASDALDKLRLERFRNSELDADTSNLHIELAIDADERTLTIRDNGIGMSRAEVMDLIGKIANSGTASFVRELKEMQTADTGTEELIGRFGVGFYSSFMVADKVTLLTRRAGESEATRWESTGEGTYTLQDVDSAPQGTAVTLHLKPADPEDRLFDYTEPQKIREIVTRYSDFITWPIRMKPIAPAPAPTRPRPRPRRAPRRRRREAGRAGDDQLAQGAVGPARVRGDRGRLQRAVQADQPRLDRPAGDHPAEHRRHPAVPGTAVPAHPRLARPVHPGQQARRAALRQPGLRDGRLRSLMPNYLRFVKGVVDSADLALNVSREILQQDRQIEAMRKRLTKKVLSTVKDMATKRPEKYATFWKEFGRVVKEGLLQDFANRDAILEVCSFETTKDAESHSTLRQYVERMDSAQEHIYYMTGESRLAIENSPYMETFKAKKVEVLLLTDPIDEIWVDSIPEFDGKKFQSIAKGQVDLDRSDDDADEAEKAQQQEQFAGMLTWLGTVLEKDVKEVRLSSRLTVSPACIVGDTYDATPALINIYKQMGQEIPQGKRILELNPTHPLVSGLRTAQSERPEDEKLAKTGEVLYGLALLAEGGQLEDPSRFVQLMADQISQGL